MAWKLNLKYFSYQMCSIIISTLIKYYYLLFLQIHFYISWIRGGFSYLYKNGVTQNDPKKHKDSYAIQNAKSSCKEQLIIDKKITKLILIPFECLSFTKNSKFLLNAKQRANSIHQGSLTFSLSFSSFTVLHLSHQVSRGQQAQREHFEV